MNSATVEYQKPMFMGVMSHGWSMPTLFKDDGDKTETQQASDVDRLLDVQVRSGDYFITLATTLDSLGRGVVDYQIRSRLEDLVSDLIHLQDNYTIVKLKK